MALNVYVCWADGLLVAATDTAPQLATENAIKFSFFCCFFSDYNYMSAAECAICRMLHFRFLYIASAVYELHVISFDGKWWTLRWLQRKWGFGVNSIIGPSDRKRPGCAEIILWAFSWIRRKSHPNAISLGYTYTKRKRLLIQLYKANPRRGWNAADISTHSGYPLI